MSVSINGSTVTSSVADIVTANDVSVSVNGNEEMRQLMTSAINSQMAALAAMSFFYSYFTFIKSDTLGDTTNNKLFFDHKRIRTG
ncbi:MAG: hypothetical protein AABZ06_03760 [Bdellovibrionota bacterium]